jgi:hypothetical protein
MSRLAICIHGMWGTPDVRRHHDAPSLAPPDEFVHDSGRALFEIAFPRLEC